MDQYLTHGQFQDLHRTRRPESTLPTRPESARAHAQCPHLGQPVHIIITSRGLPKADLDICFRGGGEGE